MKILSNGIAVVENDSHLSKWIEEQGTIEVAKGYCELFRPFIPEGGVVCDVGACLGDHTATYSNMVGPNGKVYAFEPNLHANICLVHNMSKYKNVQTFGCGLGDSESTGTIVKAPNYENNLGASQMKQGGEIKIHTLDSVARNWTRLDFLKIDAEGWEPKILNGARETIKRLRPAILMEVNRGVLAQQGSSADALLKIVNSLIYGYRPAEPHLKMDSDQLDILCLCLL